MCHIIPKWTYSISPIYRFFFFWYQIVRKSLQLIYVTLARLKNTIVEGKQYFCNPHTARTKICMQYYHKECFRVKILKFVPTYKIRATYSKQGLREMVADNIRSRDLFLEMYITIFLNKHVDRHMPFLC